MHRKRSHEEGRRQVESARARTAVGLHAEVAVGEANRAGRNLAAFLRRRGLLPIRGTAFALLALALALTPFGLLRQQIEPSL